MAKQAGSKKTTITKKSTSKTARKKAGPAIEPEGAPFAVGAGIGDEPAAAATTESAHEGGVSPKGATRRKAPRKSRSKGLDSDALAAGEARTGDDFSGERHHPADSPLDATDEDVVEDAAGELSSLDLPFQGELIPAVNKRHETTVVFVHHFGGSKRTVHRHVDLVNRLGYDAVRFNLIFNDVKPMQRLPITASLKFGTRHIWTEQIESILNAIPGRKILYSFSMPSASALDAIARRHANDVAGWICDSGPFLQLPRCVWNLYTHEYGVKSRLFRGAFTGASLLLFGLGFEHEAARLLKAVPRGFPVLSIRGWRDPLVPPSAIDEVFAQQSHLDLETLALAEGKHLDGLKFFSNQYTPRVERFLSRIS